MIGSTISHYHVLSEIGRGGMGVVYKANDTKLDRLAALNFLPTPLMAERMARARFIQEAKAASTLDHQNICTIHEIVELPTVPVTEDVVIGMAVLSLEPVRRPRMWRFYIAEVLSIWYRDAYVHCLR